MGENVFPLWSWSVMSRKFMIITKFITSDWSFASPQKAFLSQPGINLSRFTIRLPADQSVNWELGSFVMCITCNRSRFLLSIMNFFVDYWDESETVETKRQGTLRQARFASIFFSFVCLFVCFFVVNLLRHRKTLMMKCIVFLLKHVSLTSNRGEYWCLF